MRPTDRLKKGETIQIRPKGNSMTGRINDGQLVTLSPIDDKTVLQVGDAVMCKVKGKVYLHLISAIGADGRYQISNNFGRINGWAARENVYGKVIKVED